MIKFALILQLTLTCLYCEIPSDPKWPNKFQQNFTETFTYGFIKQQTKGTILYDYDTKTYKISRDNGRFDRYCGFNGLYAFQNTQCEHIVVNGDRFLHYPQKNDCCYCCSNEHGCGILKPDWLNGAQFLGQTEYQGQTVYKWNQKGLQDNFYYETVAQNPTDRVMISIDQVPNDLQEYINKRNSKFETIQLPGYCNKQKTCSILSVCTSLRKSIN
ncbi:hypothetical protein IMG5_170400 [Ichthyophthirius multifiliis]|uniref:Uncharacterized protein n=1 Tax=Ichthyophthirius multifiliis TaxID=5932 RepID=G0R1G5_ICHMU|nr:hypothetical protein IMG5_170400 [Ichthyophthirius multifiliis]EGR28688.1 hypothetical protein IMG5_170400 [Ichthyophthirius multifiliis]|eukprot:XP_004029924.1 hypothetical protein IMG5_170400 [Ichthyophthirius multifiliis]